MSLIVIMTILLHIYLTDITITTTKLKLLYIIHQQLKEAQYLGKEALKRLHIIRVQLKEAQQHLGKERQQNLSTRRLQEV